NTSCISMSFFFSSRRRHTIFSRDWSSDVCSSDLRMTFGGQNAIGKFNVFGSNGLAILKTGLLPQIENDVASVVRNLDAFSNQSVLGKRLVIRGHHQGVVDVGIDARSGYTPYDVRVKAVKTVGHHTQV